VIFMINEVNKMGSKISNLFGDYSFIKCLEDKDIIMLEDLTFSDIIQCFKVLNLSLDKQKDIMFTYKNRDKLNSKIGNDKHFSDNDVHMQDNVSEEKATAIEENKDSITQYSKVHDEESERQNNQTIYYSTKHIWFYEIDVLKEVIIYINNNEHTTVNDVYSEMREIFNVSNFNKRNLRNLIKKHYYLSSKDIISYQKKELPTIISDNKSISSNNGRYYLSTIFNLLQKYEKKGILEIIIDVITLDSDLFYYYVQSVSKSLLNNNYTLHSKKILNASNHQLNLFKKLADVYNEDNNEKTLESFCEEANPIYQDYLYYSLVNDEIEKIPDDNDYVHISPVLKNFIPNSEAVKELYEIDNIVNYKDLKNSFSWDLYQKLTDYYQEFNKFISYSQTSFIYRIESFTKNALGKNNRVIEVFKRRTAGETLEEIGNYFDVTRERIRQIEKKVQINFDKLFTDKNISMQRAIFKAYFSGLDLISLKRFKCSDITNSDLLIQMIKNNIKGEGTIQVIDKWNALQLSSTNIKEIIERILNGLPDVLSRDEYVQDKDKLRDELLDLDYYIDKNLLDTILQDKYNDYGEIYSEQKMTLRKQYHYILENYFPDGIHVYDEDAINKFKYKHYDVFNNQNIFNKSSRSISGIILDDKVGILSGRGTYIAVENMPDLDLVIAQDIENYIESQNSVVVYETLFDKFKEDLENQGIKNKYALHGILKLKLQNKLIVRRSYISKIGAKKPEKALIDFLRAKPLGLNFEEIKKLLPTFNSFYVYSIASRSPEIIHLKNQKYIHRKYINFNDNDLEIISRAINLLLSDTSQISSEILYNYLQVQHNDIMVKSIVNNRKELFSVLSIFLEDKYAFRRPFIAHEGKEIISQKKLVKQFINDKNIVEIKQITNFVNDNFNRPLHVLNLILSLIPNYMWSDQTHIINTETLDLDEKTLTEINLVLKYILKTNKRVNLFHIKYDHLPYIGLKWTPYLLWSIIKVYFDSIETNLTGNQYTNTEFIIERDE